jgi:hypothetical protein
MPGMLNVKTAKSRHDNNWYPECPLKDDTTGLGDSRLIWSLTLR